MWLGTSNMARERKNPKTKKNASCHLDFSHGQLRTLERISGTENLKTICYFSTSREEKVAWKRVHVHFALSPNKEQVGNRNIYFELDSEAVWNFEE